MLTDAGITMMKTFEIVKPEKYMNLDQICNVIESMVPHESLPDRVLRMSLRCSWSAEVMVAQFRFLAKFRQNFARFRLYQNEILQVNTRLTAFFKIYQII